MPTGYTASVADGKITTLHDFAMQCARGMGALIMMRDEPWDAPIPERFEPSTSYHDEKLVEYREELAKLDGMSDSECAAQQKAELDERLAAEARYDAEKAAQLARYEAMIAQVEAWKTDAEGIRDFMLSQLRESIKFDCSSYERESPTVLTPGEWRAERRKKLAKDVGYHEQRRAEEVSRTADRNRWLAALRASLPLAPAPASPSPLPEGEG